MTTKTSNRISPKEAAAAAGVSVQAIYKNPRLQRDPDGSIDRAAFREWLANRRAPRGGAHRNSAPKVEKTAPPVESGAVAGNWREAPALYRDGANYGNPANLPPTIIAQAVLIECGASDLAVILLRTMPEAEAKAIVVEWVELLTGDCVATIDDTEEEDYLPPPIGFASWGDHPLFTSGAMVHPWEWEEAAGAAAAWRTQQAAGAAP